MKIIHIEVSYERQFFTPQTGSMKCSISLGADLEKGDDLETERKALMEQAREAVKEEMMPFVKKATKKLSEVFHFLPEELQEQIVASMEQERN